MIPPETRTEIRRLFYAEHHTINAIAAAMGVHHETVARAIDSASFNARQIRIRQSQLDRYHDVIAETLARVPRVRATRMREILAARGFTGSTDMVRRKLQVMRGGRGCEAFVRLSMIPGEQAQCDWGHFGSLTVGRASRPLSLFVMVLSFSRHIFGRFTFDQTLESLLRCHREAFRAFQGVPRTVLYDNMKTVVIERVGAHAVRFHPTLLEFAGHYHFQQKPCAPRRPEHKGRVERAIGYLRTSFFPARTFEDLADANRQLDAWLATVANIRSWPQDRARKVDAVFAEERAKLLPLPEHETSNWLVRPAVSDRYAFIRFDLNDYSIPPALCRKPLTLTADDAEVRILDGARVVATHVRSFDKGQRITSPSHDEEILALKREALPARRREALVAAIPAAERLLEMLVERNEPIVPHLRQLYDLVRLYGVTLVAQAIDQAIARVTPRASSVAHLLERREASTSTPPPVLLDLPDRPHVRDLVIRHHELGTYDPPESVKPERKDDR
jgi:transposase